MVGYQQRSAVNAPSLLVSVDIIGFSLEIQKLGQQPRQLGKQAHNKFHR